MIHPKDLIVLHHLRNNGRMKHSALARKMDWPISTTHERVLNCINEYVLKSVALLNLQTLGYSRVLWIVRPDAKKKTSWELRITKLSAINTICSLHSGDFFIETITKTRQEEAILESELTNGAKILGSHPVLETICQEHFLESPEYLPKPATEAGTAPDSTQPLP
jgi:DNA-binding Lrp family transcriptional regulator